MHSKRRGKLILIKAEMTQKSECLFMGVRWVGNITLFKANSLQNRTKNKIELLLQNQKFCTFATLKQYNMEYTDRNM